MEFWNRFRARTNEQPSQAPHANLSQLAQQKAASLIAEGNLLEDEGMHGKALQRYEAAIALAPDLPRAHLNRGNALLALGRTQESAQAYAAALALQPDYAPAHYNLGNAQVRLRESKAAMQSYREALRIKPDFADAEVALGNLQENLQQFHDAAASYHRALLIRPDYAQVHYNLSNIQRRLGQLDAAAQSCRRALQLEPGLAEAYNNLGVVLQEQRKWADALTAFRQALDSHPSFGIAAMQAYRCANHLCDWSRRQEDEAQLASMVQRGVAPIAPFSLLSMDTPEHVDAAQLQKQAGEFFARDKWQDLLAKPLVLPGAHPRRDRLRLGYLSADFHEHATMHLLKGVLASHDKSRFLVHAYSYGGRADAMTRHAMQSCDIFRDFSSLPDDEAASLIAADGVDILVDLKGYTQDTRMEIVAQRPAPIIISWLGYPGTLGHPQMADYIIGDPIVTPPGCASNYSETLALMPHCYQPNDRSRIIGDKPTRAEAGLPDSGFVFCSFNQSYKFSPPVFDLWCRLLVEIPGSVLWLLEPEVSVMDNLRREAEVRGVNGARLIFAANLPLQEHLGRLQLADLALDTFPYNSHTTGSDAIWAGVPLVTRSGTTFASRVAASLLQASGLPELITTDVDVYFELAKSLAQSPQRLQEIRGKLATTRASMPLFDTLRFTRNLERLFLEIWDQHAMGRRDIVAIQD